MQSLKSVIFGWCFFVCFISFSAHAEERNELFFNLEKAQNSNDQLELARAYYRLGVYFDQNDSLYVSNQYLLKGLQAARKSENIKSIAQILNYLASNYSYSGTADSINAMFLEATNLFLQNGDTAKAGDVLINLGMEYVNQGNYEEALKVKLKALEYRIVCGDSTNISFYFQQIGEVYKELKLPDKWKYYLEAAAQLAENEKYARLKTRISILNDLGGIYADEGSYAQALEAYQQMIELSINNNYPNGVATANSNLVEVYFALSDPAKALEVARKAYSMSKNGGSIYRQLAATENIASCYKKLEKYTQARLYYNEVLSHMNIYDYSDIYLTVLKGSAFTESKLGNFSEAYNQLIEYQKLNDSLSSLEVKKNISLLETKFQTKEKEQQILLLSTRNQLQQEQLQRERLYFLVGILMMLLLAMFIFILLRQNKLQNLQKNLVLEQKLLRSQMNPHFIFNALSAIQMVMLGGESHAAATFLGNFAKLMRAVLKSSREEWISLTDEISFQNNYLELQKLRFEDLMSYTLEVDDTIDTDFILFPPMLIQPFLENAIEHGICKLDKDGRVEVQIQEKNNQIVATITDNGPGLTQSTPKMKDHVSYANSIFRERIQNLNKRLSIPIIYEITDRKTLSPSHNGVIVVIKVPIINRENNESYNC